MPIVNELVIRQLMECVGTADVDIADDHQRLDVYLRAVTVEACWERLLEAVRLEVDPNVSLTVVLRILEIAPEPDRDRWVSQLEHPKSRTYAERRRREMAILEDPALSDSLPDDPEVTWSQWLQSGLAIKSTEAPVLRRLADHGTTKRVRRLARRRLESL
jgi:hypothetical protein